MQERNFNPDNYPLKKEMNRGDWLSLVPGSMGCYGEPEGSPTYSYYLTSTYGETQSMSLLCVFDPDYYDMINRDVAIKVNDLFIKWEESKP